MHSVLKVNGYTFRKGGNSVKTVLSSSEKGSTLKGKTLLPLGAKSFFLEEIPFQKGLGVQESRQLTKVVSW